MKNKPLIIFLILILLFSGNYICAKPNEINQIRSEVNSLKAQREIDSLKIIQLESDFSNIIKTVESQGRSIDSQTGMIDTAFDGVSAQLSASSYAIGIVGLIVTIIVVFLGVYVKRVSDNVQSLTHDNEELLKRSIVVKNDVEALSAKIVNDSTGLYKMIKTEESNHLLDRLIEVPEDVGNLFRNLATRDLEDEHFLKLKEAYIQLTGDTEDKYHNLYARIFYMNFTGKTAFDDVLSPLFFERLEDSLLGAYENDAVKASSDFFNSVISAGINDSRQKINVYVKNLSQSKFSENEAVYFAINNVLQTRESKFSLYNSIIPEDINLNFRKEFGRLIVGYAYEELSELENITINHINELLNP